MPALAFVLYLTGGVLALLTALSVVSLLAWALAAVAFGLAVASVPVAIPSRS